MLFQKGEMPSHPTPLVVARQAVEMPASMQNKIEKGFSKGLEGVVQLHDMQGARVPLCKSFLEEEDKTSTLTCMWHGNAAKEALMLEANHCARIGTGVLELQPQGFSSKVVTS